MPTKAIRVIGYLQFRIILPIILLGASVVRFNGISLMYLACLLVSPLLPIPNRVTMRGATGIFLKLLMPLSLLPILGHIIFHVTLVAIASKENPYGSMFHNCSFKESLCRQIGFQRLDKASIPTVIRLIIPDVVVFITSLVVLVASLKITRQTSLISGTEMEIPFAPVIKSKHGHGYWKTFLHLITNITLLIAGVIWPSVFGGVYFITFLIVITLWGCYKPMGKKFGFVQRVLLFYTGSHILLLHLYQFQFFQAELPPDNFVARLLGLTGVVYTDCSNVDSLYFHPNLRWSIFLNPAILLVLYWVLAVYFRHPLSKNKSAHEEHRMSVMLSINPERQVFLHQRQDEIEWNDEKQHFDTETGSMVFSGSSNGDMDPGEDEPGRPSTPERLVENEEPLGGRYGGIAEVHETETKKASIGSEDDKKRRPWVSVLFLIMRQSYILSLIAMMAWSITYHSWLTFVFLLTACLLWMFPSSRTMCLRSSPFVLFYAEALLLAQYVFSMNLDKELPVDAGTYKLDEIGLKRFTDPGLNLALQCFYTFFMVLTLRQFISEKCSDIQDGINMEQRQNHRTSMLDSFLPMDFQGTMRDSKTIVFIGHFFWVVLCKYWIIFCSIMMAVISLQDVVIYRIIYMILFLLFVLAFQLNFTLWRKINFIFWWIVVIYSIFVLILIYTYQFEQFHIYWTNFTGFDDNLLEDIGLERYDTTGLFVKLLTPTSFLVIVILQLRYFHTPFLKLSAVDRYKTGENNINQNRSEDERLAQNMTEDEDGNDNQNSSEPEHTPKVFSTRNWVKRIVVETLSLWQKLTIKLWRLGEIHIFKLITLVVVIVAVKEVSALTAMYMLFVAALTPLAGAHWLLSHLIQLWTVIIILAKMIFQLNLVEAKFWKTHCLNSTNTSGAFNHSIEVDNAEWFGLSKIKDKSITLAYYSRLYILVLVLVAFESIIRYHQKQYFNTPDVEKPQAGIIFAKINRQEADKGIIKCFKFFANYFFYKFGLECCYIMTAVTVSIRLDSIAVVYILLVAILMMMPRRNIARVWPLYKIILAFLLLGQFVVHLGFPKGSCIEYPWLITNAMTKNLNQWLDLPDYVNKEMSGKLIADFLQLLFVSLQSYVFRVESVPASMNQYGGGDNADILADVEKNMPILVEDFTLDTSHGINLMKYLVFENMFWVTMAVIFITGATRINIFSLIYVIAVFCFMWYGKEFFLKPLRAMLRWWNFLIAYCILVLFLKTVLQLVGCVYLNVLIENHHCWLVQLFGINCLLSGSDKQGLASCPVEKDDAGLAWDVVCLTFLLFQRRIYSSHYFRHLVITLKAQNNLVSRGAELINRIMIREVNKQNEQEREILVNIKKQMKTLKKRQAKLKKDFKEPEEHFQAIRAGDYYLFEVDEEEEMRSKDRQVVTSLTYGTEPEDPNAKPTPTQMINTALDQGLEVAVETYDSDADSEKSQDILSNEPVKRNSSHVDPSEYEEPSTVNKVRLIWNFITKLWYSAVDWLIGFCNRLSRNYRLVAKKLAKEMILEKQKILDSQEPKKKRDTDSGISKTDDIRVEIEDSTFEPSGSSTFAPVKVGSLLSLDKLEKEDEEEIKQQFEESKDRLSRLTMALGLLLASRSELLCYFLMILNQMVYGSLLSLPLPLMVFLWGMLSVPRPSKTFWITVITYTEAVVVCKYMFQFGFFPWNDGNYNDNPFFPPRIIGIEKNPSYANVDIALLLALFLHRSILRKYGLWRDAADITADLEAAGQKEKSTPNSPARITESPLLQESAALDTLASIPSKKSRLGQGLAYIINPFTKFFAQVTQSSYNASADVYAPMFFCDFILFLVLVLSFNSFGPAETTGDGDVTSYIKDNKIPVPFLIMLILQFIAIIIDRALFLRKFVLGKFIFLIFLVIAIHGWMFFVLPSITKRSFFNNVAAQIWYFIKCIYFGLSAYQIRCGYPNRILGNFLTKKYAYPNLFLFKGFLAVPFLLELRALMDWIWTDSTLAIGNWLQMEDIYANIFVLKCWREIEKAYPTERAVKKRALIKYISGGFLLIVVVFIIWFPLVFFSFFNAVFIPNPPYEAKMSVSIGGYQPLFVTTTLGDSIQAVTETQFSTLKTHYSKDRISSSFLSGYQASDLSLVAFDGKSLAIWGISPASQIDMAADLANDNTTNKLTMTVEATFKREPDKALPSEVTNLFEINLRDPKYHNVRHKFASIIRRENNSTNDSVEILELFPRFIRLGSTTKAVTVEPLISGSSGIRKSNITMQLKRDESNALSQWWNLNETVSGLNPFAYKSDSNKTESKAYFITFNDRKAPEALSFLSGYGIIGLYISFILLIGRLMRLSTTNQYLTIMFRELPDVDRLLQLCLDLYLVREMKEFQLEEEIYAKIIFLYRSPETMIKFTRQTIRLGNIKKLDDDKDKEKAD
ncbi:piezo-type mechanosensitive ion channel component 2-like isoform X3 [Biomphalaria glabrata]|uniref:Piezo-type mechanosensitive ion channel component 2-like isoform X3 n=1 Tax=Biomphalaria glabrata TaxID=6526 RepID=A0A9W3AVQ7_BIOGL|nr:piezo-type mechanosensitive ion channel component 2-like isoform X3 [Biomphalaria glabrata]